MIVINRKMHQSDPYFNVGDIQSNRPRESCLQLPKRGGWSWWLVGCIRSKSSGTLSAMIEAVYLHSPADETAMPSGRSPLMCILLKRLYISYINDLYAICTSQSLDHVLYPGSFWSQSKYVHLCLHDEGSFFVFLTSYWELKTTLCDT